MTYSAFQSVLANYGTYNYLDAVLLHTPLGFNIAESQAMDELNIAERNRFLSTFIKFYEVMVEMDEPVPPEVEEDLMAILNTPLAGEVKVLTGILKAFHDTSHRQEWVKKLKGAYEIAKRVVDGLEYRLEDVQRGRESFEELVREIGPRVRREQKKYQTLFRGRGPY